MSERVSNGGLQCHAQLPLYRQQHNPAISTYLLTYLEEEDVGPQVTRKGVLARVRVRVWVRARVKVWVWVRVRVLVRVGPKANPNANPNPNQP